MDIQRSIGADIIMAFDECPPYPSEYAYAKEYGPNASLAAVVSPALMKPMANTGTPKTFSRSCRQHLPRPAKKLPAEFIASQNATGNAIGGLSVGEPEHMMYEPTDLCTDNLPYEKPVT